MSNIIEVVVRATDQASGTVEKVGGAFGKISSVVLGTAAAIGAASVASVAFTSKMADGIEQVSDAAVRLGTTATKLSELHFAADLANVSAETFNNSMQIMQRTAASAAEDGGKLAQSMARIGINAKDFSALPIDDKLAVVADRFKNVSDAGQRARLANELFGRSGAAMLQMLDQGAEGLARAAEEARKFGVVIGPQQAANAKAYGDMLDRVGAASTGLGRTIAGELMPMITGLGNRFANFIAENREAVGAWVSSVIRNLLAFGIVAVQVFDKVRNYLSQVFDTGGIGMLVKDFVNVVGFAFNKILELARIVVSRFFEYWAFTLKAIPTLVYEIFKTAFLTVLDLAVTVGQRLWDALKGNVPTTGWFDDLGDVLSRSVNQVVEDVRPTMQGVGEIGKELLGDLKTFGIQTGSEVSSAMGDAFDIDWSNALEQADGVISKVSEFGEVTTETMTQLNEQVPGFWDTMKLSADEWLASHKTAVEEISKSSFDLMMSTADGIGGAFAQMIVYGQSLSKGLQNLARQVLAQVIQMLIRIGIQRLILSRITGVAVATEAAQQASASIALAGSNMFASWAGAPWPISIGAPAAAAAAIAGATGAYGAGAAAGKGVAIAGGLHGGMEYVPAESTYLLQRGERVLSPRQNEDLTSALQGGSESSGRAINLNMDEDGVFSGRAVRSLFRAFVQEARLNGVTINGVSL